MVKSHIIQQDDETISETGIVDRVSISIYFTLMCCMFSLSLYIYVMNA